MDIENPCFNKDEINLSDEDDEVIIEHKTASLKRETANGVMAPLDGLLALPANNESMIQESNKTEAMETAVIPAEKVIVLNTSDECDVPSQTNNSNPPVVVCGQLIEADSTDTLKQSENSLGIIDDRKTSIEQLDKNNEGNTI